MLQKGRGRRKRECMILWYANQVERLTSVVVMNVLGCYLLVLHPQDFRRIFPFLHNINFCKALDTLLFKMLLEANAILVFLSVCMHIRT